MILNDIETGFPKAIINGSKLTAMRTGAVGATAVKYLAHDHSETLGVVGAGVQAYHQILLSQKQRDFKRILISDKNRSYAEILKNKLEGKTPGIEISLARDANELVEESDVIITASSSEKPVFETDMTRFKKKCLIGIGSYKPKMQEIPSEAFSGFDHIFVDTPFAAEESGDIKIPLDLNIISERDVIPFRNIISKEVHPDKNGLNFFKSVGMSLFDLTVAEMVRSKMIQKGFGQEINL